METSMSKPIMNDEVYDISWPQPTNVEIHVAPTSISEIEKSFVLDTLESNWIGPGGAYNNLVENFLSETLRQDTILVTNGTIAIVLALQALGVGPGDEVIVPDLTYAATASAVVMVGATPIFADVNLDSWCIEVENIEKLITNKTKAVIVVHLYGNMGEVKSLSAFCKMKSLYLIEDCAEAFLAKDPEGKIAGTYGDVATFSFFANKLITSGEGGAVTTPNKTLLKRMQLLRGQGMDPVKRYFFVSPGSNYRMTNVQAAILWGQLQRLGEIFSTRKAQEVLYKDSLGSIAVSSIETPKSIRAPWLYTCRLLGVSLSKKVGLAKNLAEQGIETRPVFYPLTAMPAFKKFKGLENLNTRVIAEEGITLPTGSHVDDVTIKRISSLVLDFIKE
jgi:perosamine synthetase